MARAADPLALPAVPPPAPADHPRRDALVAAAFVLALAIAGAGAWSGRERSELAYEQRRAAPWPSWREAGGARAATAAFERAFGDRFAGRPALVRAHHATKAIGFGVSPVPKVMLGRDGWLYFLGEDARALDRHFRGTAPFDAAPEAVASEFARRHDALAARGIAYVVVVVPDKFSVYPEHLPGWVVRAAQTPLDRVSAAVSAQRRVRFLDLRAPLVAAKDGTPVYYLTDSHWNVRGAAIGYDALMREVQAALPGRVAGIVPVALPDYDPRTDRYSGDLANMLGLPRHFREPDRASFWKLLQVALCAAPRRTSVVRRDRGVGVRPRGAAGRVGAARLDGDPARADARRELPPRDVRLDARARSPGDRGGAPRHRHRAAGRARARARAAPPGRRRRGALTPSRGGGAATRPRGAAPPPCRAPGSCA
jgi:hypothetical protein